MTKPRARDIGIPFRGQPGSLNAITDVPGVEVGMKTLIAGEGRLEIGKGPVRTGVTIIHPRGRVRTFEPVWAGRHSFNGNGEMTGVHWIDEAGHFTGPLAITNTGAIGMTHHALIRWMVEHPVFEAYEQDWMLPVAAETWDGFLNDVHGQHVRADDVMDACDSAAAGAVEEGNAGGGTGMICYEFKGGTGTASRVIEAAGETHTLGVLVQANFGKRADLTVCGVPVGLHLDDHRVFTGDSGSIIAVCATDAPLMPNQLERVARRLGLGMARTGTYGANSSGDIFLAFSTAGAVESGNGKGAVEYLADGAIDAVFEAAVSATEEAIVNALVAAETMTGRDGNTVHAIDHEALKNLMGNRSDG